MNEARKMRLEKKLAGLSRTAHEPRVESGEPKGLCSKFAGAAWLKEGEKWPRCKGCKRPMHLLLQLLARDAPPGTVSLAEGAVLQIFHCGSTGRCDTGGSTSAPGGTGVLMRVLEEKKLRPPGDVPDGGGLSKRIVGFESRAEVPGADDAEGAARFNAKELRMMRDRGPSGGTKLGGWADWIQRKHEAECRKCGNPMRFVLQLQSERHIAVGFGDSGLAYMHQCEAHPKELAFSWSST